MHYLVTNNHEKTFEMLEKMIQLGSSVHTQAEGRTPLFVYCTRSFKKSLKILQLFIDSGADVNQKVQRNFLEISDRKDINGWSCIHGVAKAGDFEAVKFLVQA